MSYYWLTHRILNSGLNSVLNSVFHTKVDFNSLKFSNFSAKLLEGMVRLILGLLFFVKQFGERVDEYITADNVLSNEVQLRSYMRLI